MSLPWNNGGVRDHGWLIERFLAALVGASEFFPMQVHTEKLRAELPPVLIKHRVY